MIPLELYLNCTRIVHLHEHRLLFGLLNLGEAYLKPTFLMQEQKLAPVNMNELRNPFVSCLHLSYLCLLCSATLNHHTSDHICCHLVS